MATSPSRAASLRSALTASSRLPRGRPRCRPCRGPWPPSSRCSGSKKWITRDGRGRDLRIGAGAPTARGRKKSLGLRMGANVAARGDGVMTAVTPRARTARTATESPLRPCDGAATAPHGQRHRLVGEAMSKSGSSGIDVADDRTWPAWHAWLGRHRVRRQRPGRAAPPWLPKEVDLIPRSKDTGGRLLRRPGAGHGC